MSYLRTRYGAALGDEFLVAQGGRYGRGSRVIQTAFTKPVERGGRAAAPCNPAVDKSCTPQPGSGGGLSTSTQPAGGSMPPPPPSGPTPGFTTGSGSQPAGSGGSAPPPAPSSSGGSPPAPRGHRGGGGRRIFGGATTPVVVHVTVAPPRAAAPGEPGRRVVTDLDGNSVPVTISPPTTATGRWLLIAALVGGAYLLLSDKDGAP